MSDLRVSALGFYSFALHLYPRAFRVRYRNELMHAAWSELHQSTDPFRTTLELLWDTLTSALREQWRAASFGQGALLPINLLVFSSFLLILSVFYQQILRRHADRQPSITIGWITPSTMPAAQAARIHTPQYELSSPEYLHSPSVFVATFNAAGQVISSNAKLHGALPQPPVGIFSHMVEDKLYKVTWQPQQGLRYALTGRRLADGHYIVGGQSLIPTESSIANFNSVLRRLGMALLLSTFALFLALRRRALHKI